MAQDHGEKEKEGHAGLGLCKLCLSVCDGESGHRLTQAAVVLKQLTGQTPVFPKLATPSGPLASGEMKRWLSIAKFVDQGRRKP
ncbi:60S ribosomal protein L11 [Lemmus lemmus]